MKTEKADKKDILRDDCPNCGAPCEVSWAGLELVENSGDETLASKHYKYSPLIPEKGAKHEMTTDEKIERLQSLQRALESCTQPVTGHTDPLSNNDCWNWMRELLEEVRAEYFALQAQNAQLAQSLKEAKLTWTRFEDKLPEPDQNILIVWPSGTIKPEFRKLSAEALQLDWSDMRWLPVPDFKTKP